MTKTKAVSVNNQLAQGSASKLKMKQNKTTMKFTGRWIQKMWEAKLQFSHRNLSQFLYFSFFVFLLF